MLRARLTLFATLIGLLSCGEKAPAPTPEPKPELEGSLRWGLRAGDADDQFGTHLSIDRAGRILWGAAFEGVVDVGLGPLESRGEIDGARVEVDADGHPTRQLQIGNSGYDQDLFEWAGDGGQIVSATFTDEVFVGQAVSFESRGDQDILLAKLREDGRVEWAKQLGDGLKQHSGPALPGPNGTFVTSGYLAPGSVIDFGTGPVEVDSGRCGNFVVSLDGSGTALWSRVFDGVDSDWGLALAVGSGGQIAVTGQVIGDVDLGGGVLPGREDPDVLIAKLGSDGVEEWSLRLGDESKQVGSKVLFTPDGDILVAGTFQGVISIGAFELVSDGDSWDPFIIALSEGGEPRWARSFSGPGHDETYALAIDPAGHLLLGGKLDEELDLGCGQLQSQDGFDAFVAKLDADGTCVWNRQLSGSGAQAVTSLAAGADGAVFATGYLESALELDGERFVSAGGYDAFLISLSP